MVTIAIHLWLVLIIGSWTWLPWWLFWLLLPTVSLFALGLGSKVEEWLGVDRGVLRLSEGRLEVLQLGLPRFLPISLGKDLGPVRTLARRASLDWEPEYGFSWEVQLELGPVVLVGWGESIVLSSDCQERLRNTPLDSCYVLQAVSAIDKEMSAAWPRERTSALGRLLERHTGLSCLDLPPSDEACQATQASKDFLS